MLEVGVLTSLEPTMLGVDDESKEGNSPGYGIKNKKSLTYVP